MYCDWPVLRRCCFFIPLRRGVLALAYLNVLFSGYMIAVYSISFVQWTPKIIYHGMVVPMPEEISILIYALEVGFALLLIYGAHMKKRKPLVLYYYFGISTTLASTLMGILDVVLSNSLLPEMVLLAFSGLCVQAYQLILVWSLIKKIDEDGPIAYENQLHQVINGHPKADANKYSPSTAPIQTEVV